MRLTLVGALAATAAAAPAGAFAVDYLSVEQAAQLMFPEADRFEPREVSLDATQLHGLAAPGVSGRRAGRCASRSVPDRRSAMSSATR